MGTVNIVQLEEMCIDANGVTMPVAKMPALSSENVTSGAASAQSAAFAATCHYVHISTDTTVRILFGSNPTAVATSERLLADSDRYFGIVAGQKVAVIDE